MLPASTRSVTPFSRSRPSPFAAAPMRHQACATFSTVSGSASPSSARTKTARPVARHLSMRRRGNPPLPAMTPRQPSGAPAGLSAIRPFRLADRTARIGPNEGDDVVDRADAAKPLGDLVDALDQRPLAREKTVIGAAQPLDVVAAKAAALHADDVEAVETRPVAHHLTVGDDVALDPGHAANHRVPSDPHELMDCREPAEQRMVLDDDMAGEGRVIGHDHIISDLAVVRDMRPDHQQAIVADARNHAAAGGAGIDRHVLADRVVAADFERRRLAVIFQILRLVPDRSEWENPRPLADCRPPLNYDMRFEADAERQHNMFSDDAIGSDDDVVRQACARRDDRGGMDIWHRQSGLVVQDHRGKNRFRRELSADLGLAFELPDIATVALLRDLNLQDAAGYDRTAKPGIVDAHEIDELALRRRPQRVHHQDRRGLRHGLNDQYARHHRARGEMPAKIIFIRRHVLDAGCALVGDDVGDPVDHQKRVTMRDHLHDPLAIDLDAVVHRGRRLAHPPSFFLARRRIMAICRQNAITGTAGDPITVSLGATSSINPACAPIRARAPIFKCPANRACPPPMTKSPSLALPEIPTCPARMQPRPSTTLCPICTRLSIIVPGPITVSCPEPRSIVVFAPISTSSPTITRPSRGTLIGPLGAGAKPNPACPIRTPGCSTTRAPMRQWLRVTLAPTRQSSPSSTPASITVFGPI